MAYTLQEYYDGPANTQIALTTNLWGCQTFTPASTFTITAVSILCYRSLPPGTINVGIFATSAGKPTGSALCSSTFDPSAITTDSAGEWKFVTFASPVELTASTVYALVVSRSDTDGTFYWKLDATSPTYAGGSWVRSNDAGASWTIYTATDTLFRTYSGSDTTVVEASISGGFTGGGSIVLGVATSESLSIAGGFTGGGSIFLLGSSAWAGNYDTKQYVVAFGNNQVWYCEV